MKILLMNNPIYHFCKSPIDFILAFFLVCMLSPIFFFVGLLIFFDLGRPIFFKQKRGGLNENPFYIIKFKTKKNNNNKNINIKDDKRRTSNLGRILRKYSIDEIPSLINIIKGDMSLVGPRPLLFEYHKLYNVHQKKRFLVKPGITGWAQINGRNSISWEQKFNLDIWYIENKSFYLDIKIIVKTIAKIFYNNDIDSSKSITMSKFKGSKE